MLEWLSRLVCLVLVVLLGSIERVLLVVEYVLLAPAFAVALWERVYL